MRVMIVNLFDAYEQQRLGQETSHIYYKNQRLMAWQGALRIQHTILFFAESICLGHLYRVAKLFNYCSKREYLFFMDIVLKYGYFNTWAERQKFEKIYYHLHAVETRNIAELYTEIKHIMCGIGEVSRPCSFTKKYD